MPLYTDHRPKTMEEMIGNEKTIASLKAVIGREAGLRPHAFLFTGQSGCGKTTLSRIVAKTLGCNMQWDYKEINAADFRGIDSAREIITQAQMKPMGGECRVWCIDECHQMTKEAQNVVLKLLEDTPPWVYIILATTNPEKILKTIQTRCTHYLVEPLNEKQLAQLLIRVSKAEGVTVPQEVIEQIVNDSMGSPRMSLVILDKILDLPMAQMKEAAAQQAEQENEIKRICQELLAKKVQWAEIAKTIREAKEEPESIRRMILGYMEAVLLNGGRREAWMVIDCLRKPTYDIGRPGLTASLFEAFVEVSSMKSSK